jgi:AmmeMemoRadiSam system protein A
MLSEPAKKELLSLARLTLHSFLSEQAVPGYVPVCADLKDKRGAFVSLHSGSELRGCIGQLEPDEPLTAVIQYCVVCAATRDTRFAPVTVEEIPSLKIEISVLEPPHRMESISEIEIGRHGLLIVRGRNRGLLLPQVATEYGWDAVQFLSQACLKAGVREKSWQDAATQVFTFEAQVFSE